MPRLEDVQRVLDLAQPLALPTALWGAVCQIGSTRVPLAGMKRRWCTASTGKGGGLLQSLRLLADWMPHRHAARFHV